MQVLESEQRGGGRALRLDPRVLELIAVQAEFACLSDRSAQKGRLRRQRDALLGKLDHAQREQLRYIALTLEMLIERTATADEGDSGAAEGDHRE